MYVCVCMYGVRAICMYANVCMYTCMYACKEYVVGIPYIYTYIYDKL